MNRRDLMKLVAAQTALVALPAAALAEAKSTHPAVTLRNSQFELSLTAGMGLRCKLVHRPTGTVLANGCYSYSFGVPTLAQPQEDGSIVTLQGKMENGMGVRHRFTVNAPASWMEEEIEFSNSSSIPLDLHNARAGFVLPLPFEDGKVQEPWTEYKFTAIPFRREPDGKKNQYADFSLNQILTQQYSSELWTIVRRNVRFISTRGGLAYHRIGLINFLARLFAGPERLMWAPCTFPDEGIRSSR